MRFFGERAILFSSCNSGKFLEQYDAGSRNPSRPSSPLRGQASIVLPAAELPLYTLIAAPVDSTRDDEMSPQDRATCGKVEFFLIASPKALDLHARKEAAKARHLEAARRGRETRESRKAAAASAAAEEAAQEDNVGALAPRAVATRRRVKKDARRAKATEEEPEDTWEAMRSELFMEEAMGFARVRRGACSACWPEVDACSIGVHCACSYPQEYLRRVFNTATDLCRRDRIWKKLYEPLPSAYDILPPVSSAAGGSRKPGSVAPTVQLNERLYVRISSAEFNLLLRCSERRPLHRWACQRQRGHICAFLSCDSPCCRADLFSLYHAALIRGCKSCNPSRLCGCRWCPT